MKNKKLTLVTILVLLGVAEALRAQSAPPTPQQPPAGPMVLGVQLPQGATLIQKVAGYRSYRIPDEIKKVEQFFRTSFSNAKDIIITARTTGDVRVIIFEDKGQRAWSTIQLSGVVGGKNSYIVINTDTPTVIDEHR